MSNSEYILGCGFCCLAMAAGLFNFVMIGLIGVLLFPIAIGLLITGGILARNSDVPMRSAVPGLILFLAGSALLVFTAGYASQLAFQVALQTTHPMQPVPEVGDWTLLAVLYPVSAAVIVLGLRLRTRWSPIRCLSWAGAVLVVCPATLAMFFVLSFFLPITA
ncbi:MAG: hypothetical protein HZA46_10715 [Planctomycetales bacterium]|nr:hypothetical protein [Planctomycetales bacterium]